MVAEAPVLVAAAAALAVLFDQGGEDSSPLLGVPRPLEREPHEVHAGEPISHDDLLDFHHLLQDDTRLNAALADVING